MLDSFAQQNAVLLGEHAALRAEHAVLRAENVSLRTRVFELEQALERMSLRLDKLEVRTSSSLQWLAKAFDEYRRQEENAALKAENAAKKPE